MLTGSNSTSADLPLFLALCLNSRNSQGLDSGNLTWDEEPVRQAAQVSYVLADRQGRPVAWVAPKYRRAER